MKSNSFSKRNLFILCSLLVLVASCKESPSTEKEQTTQTEEATNSEEIYNTLRPNQENQSDRDELIANDNALNNIDSGSSNSFTKQDSLEFFKRFSPKTQTFTINTGKDQHVFGERGTHIAIEKNSFVFEDGTPVKSEVKIELKEFYDKKTILLAGLATQTENGFLESGGMVHLQATADEKKVKLKKEITIEMPTANTKVSSQEGMQVYFASNNSTRFSSDINSPLNPPTTWQTNGKSIRVEVPEQDYFKWKYMGTLEHRFDKTEDTECDCADTHLVYEKVETLSEAISYEIDFTHPVKEPKFLKERIQKTELKKDFHRIYPVDKGTRIIGKPSHLVYNFYPFLEDTTYYYDTLRIAFEIEKNRIGMVVEQLKSTNNAIESYHTQTAIRSTSGLFVTANLNKRDICPQSKNRFFLHSIQSLSEVLPEVEGKRGTWKRIQKGTEEAYHIKYKKRKNPIMVWTGVIKTMKTRYNNEYYYEGKNRTYKKYVDEELKKQYDIAKAKYAKWVEEKTKNNPSTVLATNYIMKTMKLGWTNCDRGFMRGGPDVITQTTTPVSLIFERLNSVITSRRDERHDTSYFLSVLREQPVILFGLKKKDGKLLMALKRTVIGTETIQEEHLEYKEVTFQEMQDQLDYLLI